MFTGKSVKYKAKNLKVLTDLIVFTSGFYSPSWGAHLGCWLILYRVKHALQDSK